MKKKSSIPHAIDIWEEKSNTVWPFIKEMLMEYGL
jgi:hypothetical protein